MKYTKEIVEAACINADTIDDVKKILGINGSYAYTLLKKYNLSITKKKIGRPNIKNTTQIRAECTAIAKAKREALFKVTEFLNTVYDEVPYQQRTWHIRNDILNIEYCICGNPMVFITKRYKYCSKVCTNIVVDKKREETMIKKYGVTNAFMSDEIKEKIEKTCLIKYGTTNGGASTNGHYKDYILPSGKKIRVQGFENFALDILLKKYDESDLLFGPKEIHKELGIIRYIVNGNVHKYFPDIFIKSLNKIIEVKSTWTFDRKGKDKDLLNTNRLKEQACIEKGLDFEFMIMSKDGVQIKII